MNLYNVKKNPFLPLPGLCLILRQLSSLPLNALWLRHSALALPAGVIPALGSFLPTLADTRPLALPSPFFPSNTARQTGPSQFSEE